MDRNDVMRKVQALMDRADHKNTGEHERAACLAKADALMASYSIAQFELDFAKPGQTRQKPEVREFDLPYHNDWDATQIQLTLFSDFARHTGCLVAKLGQKAKVVGFKDDLDWLDWLFTSVRLHMLNTMVPKPTTEMTREENIVLLKETGLAWKDIYDKLLPVFYKHPRFQKLVVKGDQASDWYNVVIEGQAFPKTMPRPWGVWCTSVYTKHCERNGLPRNYASPGVYRRSFVDGYIRTIRLRLREMAVARGEAGVGKELVLANKEGDLKEMLYEVRPDLRPHPPECECDTCHAGKCRNKECDREICVQRRKPVKFSSARYRELKYDNGAARNGSRAANSANLMGGRNNVGSNKKEIS